MDKSKYFDDLGNENSSKNTFSGNALEIGFGTIANIKMTRKKGFSCYGLDVAEEAVGRGRYFLDKENIKDISLQKWTPYELPFKNDKFSLVYGLQSLYYNLEIEKVIDEVYRVLKPGGTFLFSFFPSASEYIRYIDIVDENIIKWSEEHPNFRIRGAYLRYFKSKGQLMELFYKFKNLRVFTTETDELPKFHSWWYSSSIPLYGRLRNSTKGNIL